MLQTRDGSDAHRWTFFRAGGFRSGQAGLGRRFGEPGRARPKALGRPGLPDNGLDIDAAHAGAHRHRQGRPGACPRADRRGGFACNNLKTRTICSRRGRPAAGRDQRRAPRGKGPAGVGPAHPGRHRQADLTSITPEDVGDPARIFADTVFNGDGVITATAAEDDATRALIREIAETIGTVPDCSGKPASTARSPTRSSPKRAPIAPGSPGAKRARRMSFPSALTNGRRPPRPWRR